MKGSGEKKQIIGEQSAPSARYRTLNDAALITALRNEEPVAFVEFIERFQPMLSLHAARFHVDPSERDEWVTELLHDVMLTLIKPKVRIPDSLRGYLVRACRNKAYSANRSRTRRCVREDQAEWQTSPNDDSAAVDDHEDQSTRDVLSPALRRFADAVEELLSAEERELLDWWQECVPLRTIASWLGTSRAAAAQRLWRLRERLRRDGLKTLTTFNSGDQAEIRRFLRRATSTERERANDDA